MIEMIDTSNDAPRVAQATAAARHGSQDIPLLDVPVMPSLIPSPSLHMYTVSDTAATRGTVCALERFAPAPEEARI